MTETTTTQAKPNYLLWAIVAWAVYWFVTKNQPAPNPEPTPKPTPGQLAEAVKSVLPTIKAEFRKIFEESAQRVESGQITSDAELFEYVFPATKAAREAANKHFDVQLDLALPRNDDGTFDGKEKEAAAVLRKIANSW